MNASVRRLEAAVGLLLVIGLVGCSGQSAPPAAAPTSAAPATTAAAPTPTPTPTPTGVIEVTAATFVDTLTKAQAALPAVSCRFTMAAGAGAQAVNATGAMRYGAAGTEMAMSMTVPGAGAIDMRMVGGIIYMNMGDATGGKFVAVDPSDPSLGVDMPSDVNPAQSAKDLSGAILSVTKVGEPVTIGGARSQGFDVVVDLTKVTGPSRTSLDSAAKQAAATGQTLPPTVTYHYWISAAGLVQRIGYDLLGASSTMTFEGWGEPVEVTAPTADQIVNLDQG